MITIKNSNNSNKKGIIYRNKDVIGVCTNAETLLDILCQIKKEQSDEYTMEVEVEIEENITRTYVYHFTKDGKMIPASYPGVVLWTDELNKKLLYLYNFSVKYEA